MMNSRGEIGVGRLILIAVGAIFALVIIQQIGVNQGIATNKLLAYNETDTLSACWQNVTVATQVNTSRASCNITVDRFTNGEWQTANCPLTNVVMRTGANTTGTVDVDYVVFDEVIALQNTTLWYNNTANGNLTYTDYNFCPVGYNTDSGSRGIASLWMIFSALALLAFVLIGINRDWFDF